MYLITGAGGFLGRYVIDRLIEAGIKPSHIVGTVRPEATSAPAALPASNIFGIDIRVRDDLNALPNDVEWKGVVHLAAALMIDGHPPLEYFATNAIGTMNVLDWARANRVPRFLYTHTHSDMNRADLLLRDGEEPRFANYGTPSLDLDKDSLPFILSKIAGARMVLEHIAQGSFDGAVMRLSNIRGAGSQDTKYGCVFHSFIQKAMKDEPIELWGELTTRRDLIYVKDVATAVFFYLKHTGKLSGIYNIGAGNGLSIEAEAKAIIKVFSPTGNTPLVYRPEIPEVRKHSSVFDISRSHREIGWRPQFTYEEGLMEMKKIMGVK